jgi:hypothetical protein
MPSFLPVQKNFEITKGVALIYPFQYYQGVPTTMRVVDLTSATATLTILSGAGATLLTVSNGATTPASGIYFGGVQNNPANGIVTIQISATDSAAITWKYAQYTLGLTTVAFGLQKLMYGTFAIAGSLP